MHPVTTAAPGFSGVIPPIATPFTEDRQIDHESLRSLLRYQMDAGISGAFMLGSTGEMAALSRVERADILRTAVDEVSGKIPVLAGVISTGTRDVIDLAREAESLGVDAIVACAPYYIRPGADEIVRHFAAIREAIDIPIFAYEVPANVQTTIPTSVIARLAETGTIVGIKDSSGNDAGLRDIVMATRHISGFAVFTGSELTVDHAMATGATGVVPGLGNVDPAGYVRILDAMQRGDRDAARTEQERLCRLFRIIAQAEPGRVGFTSGALGGFKTALQLLGIIATNQMAMPLSRLEGVEIERVRDILIREGMLPG